MKLFNKIKTAILGLFGKKKPMVVVVKSGQAFSENVVCHYNPDLDSNPYRDAIIEDLY